MKEEKVVLAFSSSSSSSSTLSHIVVDQIDIEMGSRDVSPTNTDGDRMSVKRRGRKSISDEMKTFQFHSFCFVIRHIRLYEISDHVST